MQTAPSREQVRFDGNTPSLARPAQRGHENRVLAGGVRRKERDDVTVVEGETGGAESLRVRGQIGASAGQSRFQVGETIAAITERAREIVEPRDPIEDGRRVPAERLLQAEIRGPIPEDAPGERFGRIPGRPAEIPAGGNALGAAS